MSSVNLFKDQIANYDNPINMYDMSNEDIEVLTMKFRTKPNIGKYIIFTDDHYGGYGQTDEYKGKQIINESADRDKRDINLSDKFVDVYVVPRVGGRSKKYRIRKRRNSRKRSRRQTKTKK